MTALGKARVPTEAELKRLFGVTRAGAHAYRNAAMLAVSYRLGLRAKEIAALRVRHVLDPSGRLLDECVLTEAMTKGGKPRVAYLSNPAVRQALRDYLDDRPNGFWCNRHLDPHLDPVGYLLRPSQSDGLQRRLI